MSIVHSRLDGKDVKALDQLARAKGSSRSTEIRAAVKMYLAQYTGEPDINDLAKRLRELESSLNEYKSKLDNLIYQYNLIKQ